MSYKVITVLLFFGFVIAAPPHPQLSEIFEASGELVLYSRNQTFHGQMILVMDQPKGKGFEHWSFHSHYEHNRKLLQRYDLNETFVEENNKCSKNIVSGKMPLFWNWVKEATYQGRENVNNHPVDFWQLQKGHATLRIGVSAENSNHLIVFERKANTRHIFVHFRNFEVKTPNEHKFNVPRECDSIVKQKSKRQCIDRGTIMANAQVWVDDQVPYDQSSTFQGYREDCSGYVSMSWEGPQPGWTTSTLPNVCNSITQGDLQPGDILLNVGEHVVIFGGWASDDQSQYTAFEETRPGEGTVSRVTPYPYWYDTASFLPYSYNGAC